MKNSILQSKFIYFISGLLSLVLIYLFLSSFKGGYLFPSLDKIAESGYNLIVKEHVIGLFLNTFFSVLLNICLSFIIALLIAIIDMYLKNVSSLFTPFIVFLKCAPLSILTVYFFFLFGRDNGPNIICFMVIFPLIFESINTSLKEIDKGIILELQITDVSKIKKFFKILLPLILPYISMSFLMCFGFGIKVTIMGEYLMMKDNSLGLFIYNTKTYAEIEPLLALLFICVILTLILEVVSKLIIKKIRQRVY